MKSSKKGAIETSLKVIIALILSILFFIIAFLAVKRVLNITLK